MPSIAAQRFAEHLEGVTSMLELSGDRRLKPFPRRIAKTVAHAALASAVSAWEAYVEQLVDEFLTLIARPQMAEYSAVHGMLRAAAAQETKRFNTPNAENSRELLVSYTGYDPLPDWVWPARSMGAMPTRLRLNEILKVRHSFAHGFALPAYSWMTSPKGVVQLRGTSVRYCAAFLRNLVRRTDRGMRKHLGQVYGCRVSW